MQKRVYTLYRVSTLGQVEKNDIPMQKEACRTFAREHGWQIVKEFSEKGVSGFKKSAKDRDQLQQIQQAAMAGEFDILVVFMFDRLGRRDDETPFVVEWFVKQGIEVWSTQEGQQRFETHVDKLMNYIRYWQASGESSKTSIRTRTRMEQLTEEGLYTGGVVAFGYRCVKRGRTNKRNREVYDLEIDEKEAEIVRLIFHKYVYEGFGAKRLCNYLYENHILGRKGQNITNVTIVRMIQNKSYTGYLINGKVETECPQLRIIEPELFERAQELRLARKRTKGSNPTGYSCFAIYQLKQTDDLRDIRYEGLERLKASGQEVQHSNYDLVYTAPLTSPGSTPEQLDRLYEQFNLEKPPDFHSPSMSVSDIVAIRQGGRLSCYYCDRIGFEQIPGFLPGNPLKNAEMSVEDDYGMIDGIINNGSKEPQEQEKKKSVREQLQAKPRTKHKKTAPKKSAEREM